MATTAPISAAKLLMRLRRLHAEWTAANQKVERELADLIDTAERHIAKSETEAQP